MLRIVRFTLIFMLGFNFVYAQENSKSSEMEPILEKNLLKTDFLLPGINYERRIFKNFSLNINPNVFIWNYDKRNERIYKLIENYNKSKGYTNNQSAISNYEYEPSKFSVIVSLDIQARYYYNLKKRAEKGKNINFNSANYFSFKYLQKIYAFTDFKDNNINNYSSFFPENYYSLGFMWGIQRTLPNKINYSIELGGMMQKDFISVFYHPYASFSLGYVLNKDAENRK